MFFFREHLAYFSKTTVKCILHLFEQYGFIAEEYGYGNSLPAVQTRPLLKTFGELIKQKVQQSKHRTARILNLTEMVKHSSHVFSFSIFYCE